jgi:hypothetical protein
MKFVDYEEWNFREILKCELKDEGYILRYNEADKLELSLVISAATIIVAAIIAHR